MPPPTIEVGPAWHDEKAAVLALMTDPREQAVAIKAALDAAFRNGAACALSALSSCHVEVRS